MIVYRITLAAYSTRLIASGNPARWNSKEIKMIYTAESRALACLENIVHRNSKGLQNHFRVMLINIPDNILIQKITETDMIKDWKEFNKMAFTQSLGDNWIRTGNTAVLKVPSAVVTGDSNHLLNPAHKDYPSIKLLSSQPFEFDDRIKKNLS
jgi:RES domain-containing protein